MKQDVIQVQFCTMDQGTKGTKGTPQAPRPGARAARAALQLAFHCRPGGPGPGPGGLRCTLGTLGTLVHGTWATSCGNWVTSCGNVLWQRPVVETKLLEEEGHKLRTSD